MDDWKTRTEQEFKDFLEVYPRPLEVSVLIASMQDTPLTSYNDFSDGRRWPDSVVATSKLNTGYTETWTTYRVRIPPWLTVDETMLMGRRMREIYERRLDEYAKTPEGAAFVAKCTRLNMFVGGSVTEAMRPLIVDGNLTGPKS